MDYNNNNNIKISCYTVESPNVVHYKRGSTVQE